MIHKCALLIALPTMLLTGCAVEQVEKINRDMTRLSTAMSAPKAGVAASSTNNVASMPARSNGDNNFRARLVVPTDTRAQAAMDSAFSTITSVLEIHQCIKTGGMRQLNFYAVPGVGFDDHDAWLASGSRLWPNSAAFMKYHDRNKCVSVRAIDNISMPALNALKFRVVYFAEDSGETVNFFYLFKKMDGNSWKLEKIAHGQM